MPKKKFFSSIFSRSSSKQSREYDPDLETDAVPVVSTSDDNSNDEPTANQIEEIDNSTPLPSVDFSVNGNSQELVSAVPNPLGIPSRDLVANTFPPVAIPTGSLPVTNNNNMYAVNSTQAQNVFQFSHINNLHIGSVYKYQNVTGKEDGSSDPKEAVRSPKEKTRTIQTMLQSTEPVTEPYLNEISKYLGEGWKDVMRQLKFSEGQIHQAMVDFHLDGGLKEVIYQLLLDWSHNEENPKLGELTTVLWKNGQKETVHYLKLFYKAQKYANSQNSGGENKRTVPEKGVL